MKVRRRIQAILLALGMLCGATSAIASNTPQGQDTGFTLGFGWGAHRLDVDLDDRARLDPVEQAFDACGSGPELIFGKGFGPNFRTEFTFYSGTHKTYVPDLDVYTGGMRATAIVPLLPGRRLQPNLLAGFGFGAVIYESDERDDHIYAWTQGDLGAGLRLRLSRHWCLDTDFVFSILDVEREVISDEDSDLHHAGGSGRIHRFGLRLTCDF